MKVTKEIFRERGEGERRVGKMHITGSFINLNKIDIVEKCR